MADSDFTFIPAVEHPHNVQGLTAAKDREERKRRPRTPAGKSEQAKLDEPNQDNPKPVDGEPHAIDYCA
jgi:hypothetical protein